MLLGPETLAILGFSMVLTFTTLIMTRRLSPMVSLILIPTVFALVGGFGGTMGPMMLDGIAKLAPTGVMLMFAILYFSIMNDSGLFTPLVEAIIRFSKGDPRKILVGTAVLALLVSLDGDGATTYLIVLTAMLPIYQRLKLNPLFLSAIAILSVGITNLVPWGGPTARAASALHLDPSVLFLPMLPAILGAACWVVVTAYVLGLWEKKRLGILIVPLAKETTAVLETDSQPFARPRKLLFNLLLTALLILLLILGTLPMPVLFMLGCAIALVINYPRQEDQKAQFAAHAASILFVVSLIFAAGIFTGVLFGTKMVDAMTQSILLLVSGSTGPHLPVITAMISIPMTFFISNDAFYFGMLPILTKVAGTYGISAAEMGRAALIGQPVHLLSPLVPSTYLLVNLSQVDFGTHQRFTLLWALVSCLVMLIIGLSTGVIPL
jgi:CitMHS family citrate-Mg2+:H+ or citrate-Ca2+:H+ symporter